MKKITALLLIFMLLFTFSSFGAKIDGKEIKSMLLNGTTMAPLEDLARLLDLDFAPSSEDYTISEKSEDPRMLVFVNDKPEKVYTQLYVRQKDGSLRLTDEQEVTLPEKAVRIDGKLYVPYRFVLEYFDANVYWTESTGAYAYRTSYGEPALIRTDGTLRERVAVEGGFEAGAVSGKYFIYVNKDGVYRMNLETGERKALCEPGRVNVFGNIVYVLGNRKLTLIDLETCESKVVTENMAVASYTTGGGVWCDTVYGSFVYNSEGELEAEITGDFYVPWEYQDGYVYYFTNAMEMRRARADGSEDESVIKAAFYSRWVDGYIYYIDAGDFYRRFDTKTKEDIMVYGLPLEFVIDLNGKHIMNYFASEEDYKMFIADPDGKNFRQFGKDCVAAVGNAALYKDGMAGKSPSDDAIYYITENDAIKISDDTANEFYGTYDGFVYYSLH